MYGLDSFWFPGVASSSRILENTIDTNRDFDKVFSVGIFQIVHFAISKFAIWEQNEVIRGTYGRVITKRHLYQSIRKFMYIVSILCYHLILNNINDYFCYYAIHVFHFFLIGLSNKMDH